MNRGGALRPGVTLPELILVAWIFGLVMAGLARMASAHGRLSAVSQDRVRAAEIVRTVDLVLGRELRHSAGPDRRLARDSLRLRAIRGAGSVCGTDGPEIRVRYRGVRLPDPAKDSVLIIAGGNTAGSAYAIVRAAADTACGGSYRLGLDPPYSGAAGVALVFETGSYHLRDGAFRYRRGRAGRQPITEALLREGWFEPRPDRVTARMLLAADSLPRLPRQPVAARIRLLNPRGP